MPVRNATVADLDEIGSLITELAEFENSADAVAFDPAELERYLFGPDPVAHVLIAFPEGREDLVAGMALWFLTFSTWVGRPGVWLEDLFVRPEFRRKGLASELLRALEEQSDGRVELAVLDWNRPAMELYESFGARPVDGWTVYRWMPAGRPQ